MNRTLAIPHRAAARRHIFIVILTVLTAATPGCSAETEADRTHARISDTSARETPSTPTTKPEAPERTDGSGTLELSQTTFIVEDTATAASLHLYVRNTTDTMSIIDRVDPSCGCIMATVQRRNARPGDSAEIYIGLMPEQMSITQPYTVDVYMTSNPTTPLRLTIWKRQAYENRE